MTAEQVHNMAVSERQLLADARRDFAELTEIATMRMQPHTDEQARNSAVVERRLLAQLRDGAAELAHIARLRMDGEARA